jgi:hypothetical protein
MDTLPDTYGMLFRSRILKFRSNLGLKKSVSDIDATSYSELTLRFLGTILTCYKLIFPGHSITYLGFA